MKIKDLYRSKVYDLSDLNKKHLKKLNKKLLKTEYSRWFNMNDYNIWPRYLLFEEEIGFYLKNQITYAQQKDITNALELFYEEEPIFKEKQELMDVEVRYNEIKPSAIINNHYEDITIHIKVPSNQKVIISYEQV